MFKPGLNAILLILTLTLSSLKEKKPGYYIVIMYQTRYDSVAKNITSRISYFGLSPKKNKKRHFENLIAWSRDPKANVTQLERNFDLLHLYFPVHDTQVGNNFQLDTFFYKTNGLFAGGSILERKNNMLLSKLYSALLDLPDCNRYSEDVFRIIEIDGTVQYLDPIVIETYNARNRLLLSVIEKTETGDRTFRTKIFDLSGEVKEVKEFVNCRLLFNEFANTERSALEFNGKTRLDTLIYTSPAGANKLLSR